jgi:Iap family predicted aminopeptidase
MYDEYMNTISKERLLEHVRRITEIAPERLSGSEEEKKTVAYFKEVLEGDRIPVQVHEIDAYVSFPRESKLEVLSPQSGMIPCTAFAQIQSTGDAGVEGEVVYAGQGGLDDYRGLDVKGKIVLVELSYTPPRPEKLRIATVKGAVGLLMMNWGLPEHDSLPLGTVKAIWGNPTDEDFHLMPTLPAVGITRADGEKLREFCKQGPPRVRLTAKADRQWGTILLPHIVIPARGASKKFVLVGGHYDAWGGGVTCNAVGSSVKLELTRILWANRRKFHHNIWVAFWPGHETGIMEGSSWFVDRFWEELTRNCILYINVDSPGLKDADIFTAATSPQVYRFHRKVVKEVLGEKVTEYQRLARTGDQSFFGVGVPSINGRHNPTPERKKEWHGATLGWWYHSAKDTWDKMDSENLVSDARMYLAYTLHLAESVLLPFEYVFSADEIIGRLQEVQKLAGENFDLGREIKWARAYRQRALKLRQITDKLAGEKPAKKMKTILKVNECLMQVSRILTPVVSTVKGKYGQDTYGLSALSKPIPVLEAVKDYMSMPAGSAERKLLMTRLMRERNKVYDALLGVVSLIDRTLGG